VDFQNIPEEHNRISACTNFIDKNLVMVLPRPIGTIVYKKEKACENCSAFIDPPYTDFVECANDCELFDISEEGAHCEKCHQHLRIIAKKFTIEDVVHYGTTIFPTHEIATLNIPEDISVLAGNRYGKTIYHDSVSHIIKWDAPITIIIPKHVSHINNGFIQGFFAEICERWSLKDIEEKLYVFSSIPNLKDIIIQSLL
jgi:hypothetical protein